MASVDLELTTFVTRKGATSILLQGFKFRKDPQTSVSINCESFHRYFGDHFTRHSANIFLFSEGLNAEQETTRLKIRSHSNPIKRKDQRQKEDKRREIIGMLRGGEITLEEFVKQMGLLMLPVVM